MEIFLSILGDALFAAVAAIGFGAVSQPPKRSFKWIALLGAIGHSIRYVLMTYFGVEIGAASLAGGLSIGFCSVWPGLRERIPMTCLYIPALLPMIPGIYAYKTVFSLLLFMQNLKDSVKASEYMNTFFLNATVTVSVVFMLAIGATIPLFIFHRKAFSMTRDRSRCG